ncbi:ribose-5-phosphate isomerase [Parasteatoda tepidariorum]|uniref:ribose-5-phosphate isomerase n=1 Tax=Parasteatoda tepidariorum TaxID=114398 RepID=UPI001C7270EE|nr:ribose-5-phosphate isomerase [Parasteatoda tepidariorum]
MRYFLICRNFFTFIKPFHFNLNRTASNFTAMDPQEAAKKAAACQAIKDHISGNCVVGIGSGSTIVYAVEELARIVKEKNLKIPCIPTSFQAKQLIREFNLLLSDLEEYQELDYVFDGADEVDANLALIKGGGGCLTQEKIVASCTNNLIIVADSRKDSTFLGTNWTKGIPIEVIPMAYMPIKRRLEAMGGPAELRMAKAKAGPLVTDNGNFILDWKFTIKSADWRTLNQKILCFPGVVETGLFVDMAKKIYFGEEDGNVTIKI